MFPHCCCFARLAGVGIRRGGGGGRRRRRRGRRRGRGRGRGRGCGCGCWFLLYYQLIACDGAICSCLGGFAAQLLCPQL